MPFDEDRPWLAAYPPGVPANVPKPTEPLHRALERAAELYGHRPALDFMGRRTTYTELVGQVDRAASALAARGVGRGTVVAIALPNCPQHVVAFFAAMRLGAIVAEHNPTYTPDQFGHQLADCDARHIIAWDKAVPAIVAGLDGRPADIIGVDITTALPTSKRLALRVPLPKVRQLRHEMTSAPGVDIATWDDALAVAGPLDADLPGPEIDDIALLQYTGGTTGVPKGAILTHANLVVNAVQGVSWIPDLKPGQEVFYGVLPFFHAFGLSLCLNVPVHIGACVVIFPKFEPDLVLAAVKRNPGTFMPGVPPMFDRLEKAARAKGTDLSSFRYGIAGAMALDPAVAARWEERTGGMLLEGYGLTETSPIAVGNPASSDRRPGTLGLPWPSTEVRIVDQEDPTRQVADGESGELLIRGPQVFSGYWNRPAETAAMLDADGWLRTGDVVVRDPDGLIRLVDRIKEVIITGGFNVYPSQVERELAMMPQILDVAVVGVPGGDLGEQVVAAVVLAEGASLSLEQVRDWCLDRLSRYAIPRALVVLESLPRSQIGKVLRRVVRGDILDRGASAAPASS